MQRNDSALRTALAPSATWYNNLAGLLQLEGNYAEAESLCRRAIEIGEKTLGKDHPTVASGYNSLANLFEERGKYVEAEPFYRRAIVVDEKALEPTGMSPFKGETEYVRMGARELPCGRGATEFAWMKL